MYVTAPSCAPPQAQQHEWAQVTCDGATKYRSMKLLSVDPANYQDAPTEGIRRVLEQETGRAFPRSELVDTAQITSIRMGTTVRSTNCNHADKCAAHMHRHVRLLTTVRLRWQVSWCVCADASATDL